MTMRLRPVFMALVVGGSAWALTGPLARALPAPPLLSPGRWRTWLSGTDPVTAAVTLLRLGAVTLAAWLAIGLVAVAMVATVAAASDRGVGGRRAVRAVGAAGRTLQAAVPRPVLATAAVMLGAASAGCTRAHAGGSPSPLGAPGPGPQVTVTMSEAGPGTAAAPGPAPPRLAPPGSAPGGARFTPPPAPGPAHPAPAAPSAWVVRRGGSMWSTAETVVRAHDGTRAEVGRYWLAVVSDNSRPDPDLVYPGQVLELPPYPQ